MSFFLTPISSVLASGVGIDAYAQYHKNFRHSLQWCDEFNGFAGKIQEKISISNLLKPNLQKKLDRVHKLALGSINHFDPVNFSVCSEYLPIISASARGCVEKLFLETDLFLHQKKNSIYSSPLTTAGSISALLAQVLKSSAFHLNVSATCSSSLAALVFAKNILLSREYNDVLLVASEAPLHPFIFAQMKALNILASSNKDKEYPYRPFADENNLAGMCLGEGAFSFLASTKEKNDLSMKVLAVTGFNECDASLTGMHSDGRGFLSVTAKLLSIAGIAFEDIDFVIPHATGTTLNDVIEINFLKKYFLHANILPIKWLIGHLFGASAAQALLHAALLLNQKIFSTPLPYSSLIHSPNSQKKSKVGLIVSAGFGGNFYGAIVSKN